MRFLLAQRLRRDAGQSRARRADASMADGRGHAGRGGAARHGGRVPRLRQVGPDRGRGDPARRAQTVWMQLGVSTQAAASGRGRRGCTVVMDRCPAIEWPRLAHRDALEPEPRPRHFPTCRRHRKEDRHDQRRTRHHHPVHRRASAAAAAGRRLRRLGAGDDAGPDLPPVDPEADRFIGDQFSRYPEARYRITQMAFVQEPRWPRRRTASSGWSGSCEQARQQAQPQQAGPAAAIARHSSAGCSAAAARPQPQPQQGGPGGAPASAQPQYAPPPGYGAAAAAAISARLPARHVPAPGAPASSARR